MKGFRDICLAIILLVSISCQYGTRAKASCQSDTIKVIVDNIPPEQIVFRYCGVEYSVSSPYYARYYNDYGDLVYLKKTGRRKDTISIVTKQDTLAWGVVRVGGVAVHTYPLAKGKVYHLFYDAWQCRSSDVEHEPINTLMSKLAREVYYQGISSVDRLQVPFLGIEVDGKMVTSSFDKPLPAPYIIQAQKELDFLHLYVDSLQNTTIQPNVFRYIREFVIAQEMELARSSDKLRTYYSPLTTWENPILGFEVYQAEAFRKGYSLLEVGSISEASKQLKKTEIPEYYARTILSNLLQHRSEILSYKQFQKLADEYLALYPDSPLPKMIADGYSYRGSDEDKGEVLLLGADGKRKSLNEVLSSCRGDSIVLDVWATWCAPCIEDIKRGISERKKMRERGKTKYVFIAFQDNEVSWRSRLRDLGLDEEEHSYFVLNSDADWFNANNIKSLPTKLYYSPSGELVKTQVGRKI